MWFILAMAIRNNHLKSMPNISYFSMHLFKSFRILIFRIKFLELMFNLPGQNKIFRAFRAGK